MNIRSRFPIFLVSEMCEFGTVGKSTSPLDAKLASVGQPGFIRAYSRDTLSAETYQSSLHACRAAFRRATLTRRSSGGLPSEPGTISSMFRTRTTVGSPVFNQRALGMNTRSGLGFRRGLLPPEKPIHYSDDGHRAWLEIPCSSGRSFTLAGVNISRREIHASFERWGRILRRYFT